MNKIILKDWVYYHWFSLFFEDFDRWIEKSNEIAPVLFENWQSVCKIDDMSALSQEYDDLFKGTNTEIYIPLWASACKGMGDIIMDETTLDVIKTYHHWGYRHIEMDGNPPDFIGQMLRFGAYLCAAGLHDENEINLYKKALEDFINLHVIDTVKTVADGIKSQSSSALFNFVAENILNFFSGDINKSFDEEKTLEFLKESEIWEVYKNGRAETIVTEDEKIIMTAGRNNCGGRCVIRATAQENCVLQITSDISENSPQLRACIRGRGYRRTYMDGKNRLRYPMVRIGERGSGRFKRISWEEAADIVASEWIRIRDTYGVGSRYINYSTGVSASLRPDGMVRRLLNLDGGHLERYNSYSSACSTYISPYIYGDADCGISIESIVDTKYLILWGHNPVETIFGSERNEYLAQAKEKGIPIIVIDPRYSDTAVTLADEWVGIRPSTDSALADGMAYVIWTEGLKDQEFMDKFCLGFDEEHMPEGALPNQSYEAYLFGRADGIEKNPQWAENITGVPADTIIKLAREYAKAKPACILPGLAMQRGANGEQSTRSLAMLACLTGNVGISGGSAAAKDAVVEHKSPSLNTLSDPYPGKIPSFMWTKAIEHATEMTKRQDGVEGVEKLDTNIKMIFNLAGNTLVNQHSDINNTIRILKDTSKCEFILCSDVFMTSSAKFADVLLPGTSFLEGENMAGPWDFGNYVLYHNQVIEPIFGAKFEYFLLRDVAKRLGLLEQWKETDGDYREWLKFIYESTRKVETELPSFEELKKRGGYSYKKRPPFIAYEQQIKDFENNPFKTPSGKIEIYSQRLYDLGDPTEIPAIPTYVACAEGFHDPLKEKYPLQMIGWHTKRRCHSIHDTNAWLEEAEPQCLWINPKDANERDIQDGSTVEIFNDRGRVRMPVKITERIIEGVVGMAQGGWYKPDKNGVDTRGSINVLTSTRPTPIAKGNPQHTNLVEVLKISNE